MTNPVLLVSLAVIVAVVAVITVLATRPVGRREFAGNAVIALLATFAGVFAADLSSNYIKRQDDIQTIAAVETAALIDLRHRYDNLSAYINELSTTDNEAERQSLISHFTVTDSVSIDLLTREGFVRAIVPPSLINSVQEYDGVKDVTKKMLTSAVTPALATRQLKSLRDRVGNLFEAICSDRNDHGVSIANEVPELSTKMIASNRADCHLTPGRPAHIGLLRLLENPNR